MILACPTYRRQAAAEFIPEPVSNRFGNWQLMFGILADHWCLGAKLSSHCCTDYLLHFGTRFCGFQGQLDGLIHSLNKFEIHLIPNVLRDFFQVFLVLLWENDRLNPCSHPRQDLLLNAPNRED